MGENWIQNTMRWLMKKAKDKSKMKKKTLKGKFEKLDEEKKMMDQIFEANNKNKSSGNNNSPLKTVVYNNSKKVLSEKQLRILELGLNFAITPKKFPLIEYIAATESLCQSLEEYGDDESMEKAQTIRNIVLNHIRKGVEMKIKDNLSAEDKKIIN